MKRIITGICILLSMQLIAQTKNTSFTVKGIAYDMYGPFKSQKVYYSLDTDHFSPATFIMTDKEGRYKFNLADSKYKKATGGTIKFIASLGDSTGDCYASLQIEKLTHPPHYMKGRSITNDLFFYYNCEVTVYYEAEKDDEIKVVGDYTAVNTDTVSRLSIKKELFVYEEWKDLPTGENISYRGSWQIAPGGDSLFIYYHYGFDTKMGLMWKVNRTRLLKIERQGPGFILRENNFSFLKQYR
jgi:hypothetical protein